jgi:hypothetical protein
VNDGSWDEVDKAQEDDPAIVRIEEEGGKDQCNSHGGPRSLEEIVEGGVDE